VRPLPDHTPVVTAAETVNGLGIGWAAVRDALEQGRDALGEGRDLAAAFRPHTVAAPCPLPDARTHLGTPKLRKLMSDDALFATVAARRAVAVAGLARGPSRAVADERFAAYVACCTGAAGWRELVPVFRDSMDDDGRLSVARLGERGLRRCNPLFAFQVLANMPLCFLSIEEALRGDNLTFAPWDGGGTDALAEALAALRRGDADAALACGTSAMAGTQGVFWLAEQGLLSPPGVRPRPLGCSQGVEPVAGLAPADGAAALVLERLGDARRRGARPLAAVLGCARETSVGPDFTACRDAAPVERVVRRALDAAGVVAREIAAVFLSAAGDPSGDRAEASGVAAVVDGPVRIVVPAVAFGHLFAAAPLTAATLAAHALAHDGPYRPALPAGSNAAPLAERADEPFDGAALVVSAGPGGAVAAFVLEGVEP
jgi:3-oxoacyl-[acyl-carrier-protein] synthase II